MPRFNEQQKEALKSYGLSVKEGEELLKEFDKLTLGKGKVKDDEFTIIKGEMSKIIMRPTLKLFGTLKKGLEKGIIKRGKLDDLFRKIDVIEEEALKTLDNTVERARAIKILKDYKPSLANFFTIPYMNYCGAGTEIEKNVVNNVEPVNRVDALCRQHDIDYANDKTIKGIRKADEKLMKGLNSLKNLQGTETIDKQLVKGGIQMKITMEDIGVISKQSFNPLTLPNSEVIKNIFISFADKLKKKIGLIRGEIANTALNNMNKEQLEEIKLKIENDLKNVINSNLSENLSEEEKKSLIQELEKAKQQINERLGKLDEENISVEDIEPKKMSGGLSKIEALALKAKYNQMIKDGATIDKFDIPTLELLLLSKDITVNDINELAKNQNKFIKTMRSKKGAPKANKKNFGVKLSLSANQQLDRMKEIQQPFIERLGLSEVKGSVPSSSESPSDEDPSGESGESSEGPSLSSRNPQSFAGQARIKHTTSKPKESFLEDIGLSIRKALTANKKTFPDFGKLKDMFPENIRMRKQTGKFTEKELKDLIKLGYEIVDAVEDGLTSEVPQLIQEFDDQFVLVEKKPVKPPEVKEPPEAPKQPIKIKVKKPQVAEPIKPPEKTVGSQKFRVANKADDIEARIQTIVEFSDKSKKDLALNLVMRLRAIADEVQNSDFTEDTLDDVDKLLNKLGKDLSAFGISGDLIADLKNIEIELGLSSPPLEEKGQRREGAGGGAGGGEFKEEPVNVPAPPAISQQVQREAPNRPVEKLALNTGTATDDNTAPRDRRPMFFHFGTDLITETPEQQEEDIDVFANFSWVPKDGNFYNEDKNNIVKCNKRNENIRFNNGLWRPAMPKRKERIEESSSLHKKLQLLLAPIIQLEQVREPIGTRANPSLKRRIQMDTRQLYGVPSSVQRNSINNRNIFPNVVDSLRV